MPSLADKVGPQQTALVIVDLQNDFVHADGAWSKANGGLALNGQVQRIEALAAVARQHGVPVIFTRALTNPWTKSPALLDRWVVAHLETLCIEGEWGAEFAVHPQEVDLALFHYRRSS